MIVACVLLAFGKIVLLIMLVLLATVIFDRDIDNTNKNAIINEIVNNLDLDR